MRNLFPERFRWIPPAVVLGTLVLAALLAPLISPQNPYAGAELRLEDSTLPPAWARAVAPGEPLYLLGTDGQGRDIFSAVLYGLRVSLLVGVVATALAAAFGVLAGLVAGYRRGWADAVIMRLADIQLSFPSVLIALFLMVSLEQVNWFEQVMWLEQVKDIWKIVMAVAIVHWVIYARTVRGATLAEREKDYVSAIRALGARPPRILLRHILPNLTTPVLVISAVEFASVVMLEATLSFLGLGVPITRPSLGMLIQFGYQDVFSGAWWIWLFPGLALVALVLSLNWLADLLRERLLPEG